MKKDLLLQLEKTHFETTMGIEDIAARLVPLLRIQRILYRAISDVRQKASNKMLCELIAAEHPPKSKAAKGNGGRRPRGRVKKGEKRGSP